MQNIFYCFIILFSFFLVSAFGQLEECFTHWDTNKDAKVTLEEFPGGKDNIEYFRLIDTDNNGSISREELRALLAVNEQPDSIHYSKESNDKWERESKLQEQQIVQFRTKLEQLEQENNLLKRQIAERVSAPDSHRPNQQWKKQIEDMDKEMQSLRSQIAQLQAEKT